MENDEISKKQIRLNKMFADFEKEKKLQESKWHNIPTSSIFFGESSTYTKKHAKILTEIDVSKNNGYAFVGDFIPETENAQLKKDDIVISVGSIDNITWFKAFKVDLYGQLEKLIELPYTRLGQIKKECAEALNNTNEIKDKKKLEPIKDEIIKHLNQVITLTNEDAVIDACLDLKNTIDNIHLIGK